MNPLLKQISKVIVICLLSLFLVIMGCESTRTRPDFSEANTEWTVTPAESTAELHAPESDSGRLSIGKEKNDIHGNEDGFSNSKGTKTVDCGSGSGCILTFNLSGHSSGGNAPDGEKLIMRFLDRNGNTITITSARTSGGTDVRSADGQRVEYPRQLVNTLKVKLPQCGKITIETTVSEGNTPNLQSSWTVNLQQTECT